MKNLTVTIGIPAYNEEKNIGQLLQALFKQNLKGIILKKIIVYSDGSTDKTNLIVRKLSKQYSQIMLVAGKMRKGKYFRVNELFHKNKSDVIVILDADIAPNGKDFLSSFISCLKKDKKAVMASSEVRYVKPSGFSANVLYSNFLLSKYISESVREYAVSENFRGVATAYFKKFSDTLIIPKSLKDPHFYLYLAAAQVNGFRFCPNVAVLQHVPTTLIDIKQLLRRTLGKNDAELISIFGEDAVRTARHIPMRCKILGVCKTFVENPLYTPFALVIHFYFGRIIKINNVDKTPVWKVNKSTKKPVFYE